MFLKLHYKLVSFQSNLKGLIVKEGQRKYIEKIDIFI